MTVNNQRAFRENKAPKIVKEPYGHQLRKNGYDEYLDYFVHTFVSDPAHAETDL